MARSATKESTARCEADRQRSRPRPAADKTAGLFNARLARMRSTPGRMRSRATWRGHAGLQQEVVVGVLVADQVIQVSAGHAERSRLVHRQLGRRYPRTGRIPSRWQA